MNTHKRTFTLSAIILALIAALPFVLAADPFSSLEKIIYSAFRIVLDIFKLGFLKGSSDLVAFTRLMIWIITFALFHAAMQLLMGSSLRNLASAKGGQKLPAVISFCLATITAVFMPESVLFAIGVTYSAVWAAIILCAVFAGMLYICYGVIKPKEGERTSPWMHAVRLLILLFCWMLISNISLIIEASLPKVI